MPLNNFYQSHFIDFDSKLVVWWPHLLFDYFFGFPGNFRI